MASITEYDGRSSAFTPAAVVVEQVPITLTTSLTQYAIPSGPYMVPTSWRRTHLSTLVNKIISTTSDPSSTGSIPFDFICDSSLLRTTLGEYLESSGLTSETTLNLEYVRSTLPPTRLATYEHDDWVSSVDCSYNLSASNIYTTSSYDGSVRLFSPSKPEEAVYTFSTINKATVQAAKNVSLTQAKWTLDSNAIVTGGMDGRVQLWNISENVDHGTWSSSKKWHGEAHNGPVCAIDVAQGPFGASVLSGGWDGILAIWDDLPSSSPSSSADNVIEAESEHEDHDDDDVEQEDEIASKRRKTTNGRPSKVSSCSKRAPASSSKTGSLDPTMILYHATPASHSVTGSKNVLHPSSRITSLLFETTFSSSDENGGKNPNSAWSAGYNGILKGWDLSSGGSVHTSLSLPSSTAEVRPILCLTHLAPNSMVAGSVDRAIHIFDIRGGGGGGSLGVGVKNAHKGAVDVVKAHPLDTHLFASASSASEGIVKVWDSRSCKKALFSLSTTNQGMVQQGILGLDWSKDGQELVAGGKDKKITVYRGYGIGVSTITLA
ncbi:related to YTM1 - microtubule-interacting protein [Melanopsichium pennsylvanicum]|uniref:Related to YTM1 - microtubule-interacting protein n=1 Tax=Melanopsichium pennsylvanicum TaxID=63383 RepID=A0AAJ4XM57_9BASI|nr:related to YTM1 - microtubule-interacting protein [Melanopsichium pennsylvanicum]